MRNVLIAAVLAATFLAAMPSHANPRPLNNLVTELAQPPAFTADNAEIEFSNPREGWVFIRLAKPGRTHPTARLDKKDSPLVWRVHPETAALESMAKLPAGKHQLRLENVKGCRLDLRAIPEIQFCYYPTNPHIAAYGPYDWQYMQKYVLNDINTIVTRSKVNPAQFDQWVREGRQWLSNASLPGLSSETAPAPEDVYAYWAKNPAVAGAGFGGLIVDEFIGASEQHYTAWAAAWDRLHHTPEFNGKKFYAWCGNMWDEPHSRHFAQALLAKDDLFVWEQYLPEGRDQQDALQRISRFKSHMARWKNELPAVMPRMVVCLGYLSAPPESLNMNPSANYHVFLDMQFHALANDPEFNGIYGLMEYMADYADEESLRYAQKLFRHYCIEGNTERFNNGPYALPHLKNPDFAGGLKNWRVQTDPDTSVDAAQMEGFSWLQGRYPKTKIGDTFCRIKNHGGKPGGVTQTLNQLTPGRLYSVKAISADPAKLAEKKDTPLAIEVKNAEMLHQYAFSFVYPSCYSHEAAGYSKEKPAWFTFHRAVFRAAGPSAELAIKDAAKSGGQTAFNFVEVQPFIEP